MRNTRLLVEIALTVAMAFILDELRLFQMPQGGTISLSMLPIIVLAYMRGAWPAVVAGALFGTVDLITPPTYIVHPAQLILDYPLAYALVGLAGLVRAPWLRARGAGIALGMAALVPGIALGAGLRYAAHTVSGAIFFAEYAPVGTPVWVYSAVYNLYVPLSALACLAAAAVLLPALCRVTIPTGEASRA